MKKFYLGAFGCLLAMGASAQTFDQIGTLQQWDVEFTLSIPEAFAVKGKNAPFSVGETEHGGLQLNVYNKSFAVERTITVDAPTSYRRVEIEKRKAVVNSTEKTEDCIMHMSEGGEDKGYRTFFAKYCSENTTYTDEYVYEWLEYMREENRGTESGSWWENAYIIEEREVDGGSLFVTMNDPNYGFGGFYFKDNQLSDYYSYNNEVQIQEGIYNDSYYYFYNMVNIEFSQEYITRYINYVGDDGYDFIRGWDRFNGYQVDSVFTTPNGETHFYTNLKTEIDGKSYPTYYFVWKDESITAHYVEEYTTTYTGEWVKETQESEYGFDCYDMMMWPWNIGQCGELDDAFILATQTLFNNDEKWEFIRPVYKEVVSDDSWETREEDRDGDGEIDYKGISYINQTTGYEIVSENGDVLATIAVAENDDCTPFVILWDDDVFFGMNISNKIYTEDIGDRYTYEEYMVVYSIDKSTTEVSKIAATPAMRVSPAIANRNSTVNVTLGSETAKNGGELIITDSNGRAIARRRIEAGQTSVPMTTDRMDSGIYNITLTEKGQKVENARIIVK